MTKTAAQAALDKLSARWTKLAETNPQHAEALKAMAANPLRALQVGGAVKEEGR